MEKSYRISGMTCGSCVSKVKSALLKTPEVNSAQVQLEAPQASIEFSSILSDKALNEIIREAGNYQIEAIKSNKNNTVDLPEVKISTYHPLILIVTFIIGISLLAQYPFQDFDWMLWMRHFMAGFFIVFAFFKILNVKGFANSYQMYDIVAAKWKTWGFIYPFVELALGISYLINWNPFLTNLTTVVVLGVSSIGVIKSNLDKRKIKCACLGDVFNLPMSTVTIVEDITMVVMAALMLNG